ncbi:hypothetical protein VNO78_16224 [Psophocarpus tetragonolobus]|uniref:Uncharacterized protein n=1 Tax=Psophocarpus tetragonolobus TaxID=3891 RepID=A0AAN9SHH5_PSOTE
MRFVGGRTVVVRVQGGLEEVEADKGAIEEDGGFESEGFVVEEDDEIKVWENMVAPHGSGYVGNNTMNYALKMEMELDLNKEIDLMDMIYRKA